jgi:hypothetical protein
MVLKCEFWNIAPAYCNWEIYISKHRVSLSYQSFKWIWPTLLFFIIKFKLQAIAWFQCLFSEHQILRWLYGLAKFANNLDVDTSIGLLYKIATDSHNYLDGSRRFTTMVLKKSKPQFWYIATILTKLENNQRTTYETANPLLVLWWKPPVLWSFWNNQNWHSLIVSKTRIGRFSDSEIFFKNRTGNY